MADDAFFDQFETVAAPAAPVAPDSLPNIATQEDAFFDQFETVQPPGRDFSAITNEDIASAAQRVKRNSEMERMLKGSLIDPATGQPSYTPEQRQEDLQILSLAEARQRGAEASAQGERMERLEGSSPALSGAAAVTSIPVAFGGLGLTLGSKIPGLERVIAPELARTAQAQDVLSNIASQNPKTAALSQSLAGMMAGGGGGAAVRGVQSAGALARGELSQAGKLAGQSLAQGTPGAVAVPAFSTGVRALSDQETTLEDLIKEAAMGYAASGRMPSGVVGSATPGAGLVDKAADSLRASAKKSVEQALGATTKAGKKQASRVADQLLERPFGETFALTRQGIKSKAAAKAEAAGEAIDDLGKLEGKVSPKKIVDALEKKKGDFIVDDVEIEPDSIRRIERVQEIFNKFGDEINTESLRGVRRILDNTISESKGFFKTADEGSMLEIKKLATKNIRQILAETNPDLAALNKEFNFWTNLEEVMTTTLERTAPQTQTMANIATAAGAVSGATLPDAGMKALLFRGITQAVRSPGWKLTSARIKNSIANAISSGDESKAIEALSEVPGFNPDAYLERIQQLKNADIDAGAQTVPQAIVEPAAVVEPPALANLQQLLEASAQGRSLQPASLMRIDPQSLQGRASRVIDPSLVNLQQLILDSSRGGPPQSRQLMIRNPPQTIQSRSPLPIDPSLMDLQQLLLESAR